MSDTDFDRALTILGMDDLLELPHLSSNELALLRGLVGQRASKLLPAVSEIEARKVISDEEAVQLQDLLADEMLSDYSDEQGLSSRGIAIDDLVGKVAQFALKFHS